MTTTIAPFARHGRHERVWWNTKQRTVNDLLADYPDILDRHFLTVPRDTKEGRHVS
ncbi:hypothetical protein ACFWU5_16520 [Nocardia sp. NPDC058640]|uniref:hypothetical protein n=1 Tax=Nocardia sp. NPDC058640 TaxID=3346571 RepID=UPI00364B168C